MKTTLKNRALAPALQALTFSVTGCLATKSYIDPKLAHVSYQELQIPEKAQPD